MQKVSDWLHACSDPVLGNPPTQRNNVLQKAHHKRGTSNNFNSPNQLTCIMYSCAIRYSSTLMGRGIRYSLINMVAASCIRPTRGQNR